MKGAQLVAGGIPQIGKIDVGTLAYAGWILTGCAAVGETCSMPCVALFRAADGKADRAAVGMGRRFAVDGD